MRAFFILGFLWTGCSLVPGKPGQVNDPPGGGSWQPGWLEIHHIDAGPATSTLVVAPSGRSLLIDAGEDEWEGEAGAEIVGPYLKNVLGTSYLDYVLVSHFHLDHTGALGHGGLWHLFLRQGVRVGKLLHRDFSRFVGDGGATLARCRDYLADEGKAWHPEVARLGAPPGKVPSIKRPLGSRRMWGMSRPLRFIPERSLVEVTTRTIQGRLLLRPSPELNDLVLGVIGRAQHVYAMAIHAFVVASNHAHLLLSPSDAEQLARFMQAHRNFERPFCVAASHSMRVR